MSELLRPLSDFIGKNIIDLITTFISGKTICVLKFHFFNVNYRLLGMFNRDEANRGTRKKREKKDEEVKIGVI